MSRFAVLIWLLAATLAGCAARPSTDYRTGAVLLEEDFSQGFAWERYENPELGARFGVEDGVYRMRLAGGSYLWALNAQAHENAAIEVYSAQISDNDDNAYGVICRADPANSGEGYYFMISGDGYWSIRRGRGGRVESLIDFTQSDAIHRGRSLNLVRVLCIDDYLALYVNDQFVGETRDRLYTRGFAGFAVAAPEGGSVDVSFDNLRIVEASLP